MTDRRRALLSVFDKTHLVPFARRLHDLGYDLIASGGTQRAIAEAGLPVVSVEEVTGAPELLGGRVKTLHPHVHGAILARGTEAHAAELAEQGIEPIDVVVCNLYPFGQTVAAPDVTEAEAVEQIDIGGVTLLRAAAKNFERVTVVCDPGDYGRVGDALEAGVVDVAMRRRLALAAFRHTASYDAAIATWLAGEAEEEPLPGELHLAATGKTALRYGENPHQAGALYWFDGQAPAFEALQGKALSFNNIADLDAAWAVVEPFGEPAVAVVKHANPCGAALGQTVVEAFEQALASDPVSAFGSIIAINRPVEADLVEALGKLFVEVIVAPSFAPDALELLARRKKSCRAVVTRPVARSGGGAEPKLLADVPRGLDIRSVRGGLLVQQPDAVSADPDAWTVASRREPSNDEVRALAFVWEVVRHVKSNAIVFGRGTATVGVGAGQMNRVDAVHLAAKRAGDRSRGAVMASDAFFPFADGVEAAAEAGVTAVIQPGGSIRDDEVVEAVDRLGMAMVFTGRRHFRH